MSFYCPKIYLQSCLSKIIQNLFFFQNQIFQLFILCNISFFQSLQPVILIQKKQNLQIPQFYFAERICQMPIWMHYDEAGFRKRQKIFFLIQIFQNILERSQIKEMREYSKDLKSTILCANSDKKRCKTVNGKRKNSQSSPITDEILVGKYKYFADSLLGEGYSAKVFKGTEIDKPQKRYAIKVIDLTKFEGDTLKMLQQQITIHRNLKHKNVVECFDAIKTKNNYFLILQFCPHGSLQDFIQRKKKIGISAACQIMEQISAGYKYLLNNNIVHRDIKPSNILKLENTWKIADFGFAVRRSVSFTSSMNVGTPLYMPLQALIRSQYSFKSDIFALGVTFYQMIHGETPWESRTQQDLIQKMKTEPLLISSYVSNQDIKKFIKKACAVNHKERMTHQQFQQIQFMNFVANSSNAFKQKIVFRAISPRKSNIQTNTSSVAFALKKTQLKDTIKQSSLTQNEISAQVTICKHIYSMISNIESFLLDQKTKQFFWMTLFKFLVRFVHQTEKKSESVKTSNKNLYNQIKQLALRYEKQYLDYLKHLQVKVIRQLTLLKRSFLPGIVPEDAGISRGIMKNVDKQVMQLFRSKQKFENYKDKVEAFRALKKWFDHCSENSDAENPSCRKKIQVCHNYKQVLRNNETDYYNMRKVLISL